MSFPLFNQATFLLGDQLPKLEKLEPTQVRQHLEAYDLLVSRLPSEQTKPPLSQTLSPVQFDQLTWLEVARLMQTSAATVEPSAFAEDSEEEEDSAHEVNDRAESKVASSVSSSLPVPTPVSFEGFKQAVVDRLSRTEDLRSHLVATYGPQSKTAALSCLRAVVMSPTAAHFSAPDLASSYVARFESAVRWCGTFMVSNKKKVATFIAGVQPRSIRDFLLNEDHLKEYTSVLVAFLSEYTVLCGAVTRMGTLTVASKDDRGYATNNISITHNDSNNNNNFRARANHHSQATRDGKFSSVVSHEKHVPRRDNFSHEGQPSRGEQSSTESSRRSRDIICNHCQKPGHIAKDCRARLAAEASSTEPRREKSVAFAATPAANSQRDSGSTRSSSRPDKDRRYNKMMRATGPSSTDIPAVAVQVFAVVGAESLGLKAELDSGSQVDLIPDMWVPWLLNLGCVVRPCDMEVSWVQIPRRLHHHTLYSCVFAFPCLCRTRNRGLARLVCLLFCLSHSCTGH